MPALGAPGPDPSGPAPVVPRGRGGASRNPREIAGHGLDEISIRHLGRVRRYLAHHPRAMDVIVMVLFALPALATVIALPLPMPVDVTEHPDGTFALVTQAQHSIGTAVVAGILTVIGIAALWWRRTHPTTVLGVEILLGIAAGLATQVQIGFELAAVFALYALAATRGPRWAWCGLAAATVAFTGTMVATGIGEIALPDGSVATSARDSWVIAALLTALMAIPFLIALTIGLSVYNRRRYVSGLVDRANQLALERDQREQLAVAGERVRIARELHDVVAHSLTVMVTLAEGAARLAPRDVERASEVMREVAETGRTALADTRRVVGVLRAEDGARLTGATGTVPGTGPTALDPSAPASSPSLSGPSAPDDSGPAPLAPAPTEGLDDLVGRFRSAGLPVRLTHVGQRLPEDASLRLAVYRITQESLTNVLRYAPRSAAIDVTVVVDDGGVGVTIENRGAAGAAPPTVTGSGRGLIGMRERVAVFGGTLEAGPTAEGWRVVATLPHDSGRIGA